MKRRKRTNKIIVHCSGSSFERDHSVEAITELHTGNTKEQMPWNMSYINKRGYDACSYHLIIDREGNILTTDRDISAVGAHVRHHNNTSLGICLMGLDDFTQAQFDALIIAVDSICAMYDLDYDDVYPHNYFDNTKRCPCFNPLDILKKLN